MIIEKSTKSQRLSILLSDELNVRLSETAETKGVSVSAFVRHAVQRECDLAEEQELAKAADALATLYESDEELTVFTALDSEDFL